VVLTCSRFASITVFTVRCGFQCRRVRVSTLHMEWKRAPADMVDEQRRRLYDPAMRQTNDNVQLQLINLPDVCLEAILSNLSYDEISKYRIVSSPFNIRKNSLSFCRMPQSIDLIMCLSGLQTIRSNLQEAAQPWLQSHGEIPRAMPSHRQK